MTSWDCRLCVLAAPLAPIYLGIAYLRPTWQIGASAIFSSLALALLTTLALRTEKRWAVVLAHLAVAVYWFFSFALIGAGV